MLTVAFVDPPLQSWLEASVCGPGQPLISSHRVHLAALLLPTPGHINPLQKPTKAKHNSKVDLNGVNINNLITVFHISKTLPWTYRSVNM